VSDTNNKRIEELRGGQQIDEFDIDAGDLAVGSSGNLYASDFGHHQLRKLTENGGGLVATLGMGEITVGRFPYPAGIVVNPQGNIFVADRLHDRIVELSPSGKLLASFGTSGTARGQFNRPSDVAIDTQGNVYVADTGNDRIQKLSPSGDPLAVWGSAGTRFGHLNRPVGIALDGHGNIYVTEYFDSRLLKLSAMGKPLWATHGEQPETGL
jgi:DNA-binding beta-propeller fold protein YncE